MTHGSLFSGIGGFDLAAEWMGWQNVFHCEWNIFGQKVLKYYWPESISYNDITKTDFTIHRGRIDILTGGFPCQPYSMAGKRLGKEDDRHLWPEMLRAIREIQPRWVVGENVLGLVNWSNGLVFHEVQADLEAEGYEVQPFVLPAVSVNAPHRRDRVWFVAKNTGLNGCLFGESIEEGAEIRQQRDIGAGDTERICGEEMAGITSNPNGIGRDNGSDNRGERQVPHDQERISSESESERCGRVGGTGQICRDGDAADTNGNGQHGSDSEHEEQSGEGREYAQRHLGQSDDDGDVADTKCSRLEHWNKTRNLPSEEGKTRRERSESTNQFEANGNGECNAADTESKGLERKGRKGIGLANICTQIRVRNWDTFPTVSPICSRNDGISDRLDGITFSKWRQESIKAGGNAVVPQVVLQIFRTIDDYEKTHAQ